MSDNSIMKINEAVIEKSNTGKYDEIITLLSEENTERLIAGFVSIAAAIPAQAFNTVSDIYAKSIVAQEHLEMKNIESEAEILRHFNDQIDKAMEQLDLKDSVSVDNFTKAVTALRDALETQMKVRSKPNIFSKIFGRK